jgi:hypothetical protein
MMVALLVDAELLLMNKLTARLKKDFRENTVAETIATLTAIAIASLALQEFVKSGVANLTKK